jgi:hypothetical protein
MKKIVLMLSAMMISTIILAQTTMEDVKYILKGYDYQKSMGLDIKKGYKVKKYGDHWSKNTYKNTDYIISYVFFYNDADTINPIGIQMKMKRTDVPKTVYTFCIPTYNSSEEVWKQCTDDVHKSLSSWYEDKRGYLIAQMKFISFYITNPVVVEFEK